MYHLLTHARTRIIVTAIILVSCCAFLPASVPAETEGRTFVDDLQRTIHLSTVPVRVISLAPSITEMLFALGLDREIVAVTPFCDYPPEAAQRAKVGYANPSLERILALTPDVVIAPGEFMRADLLGKLEHLHIPTVVLTARSFQDIDKHLRLLGEVFNRSAEAGIVIDAIHRRIEQITARVRTEPPIRVLYVLHSQPLITVGPGSYLHELIELAGATNVARRASTPYPRLAMETVLREDPEVLLFPIGKSESIPVSEQESWKKWTDMTAVRTGRLLTVSSDLLNRPGPRIVEGLEILSRMLHPLPSPVEATP